MPRGLLAILGLVLLAACEFYDPATPTEISRASFVSDEPPSVTLISMVNNRSGRSAHAAVLINGSQQVLYDPAGTFQHPDLPRAGDIHYGMSPRFVRYYERYHARFSHHVEAQRVQVSRAAADELIARAQAQGKTPKMHCGLAAAAVLRPVAPFEQVRFSYFPEGMRRDFAAIPGVEKHFVYESDVGKNRAWEQEVPPPGL